MQANRQQPAIDIAGDLTPADRVLAISGSIAFGTFRAKPSEPVFAGSSGLSCYYLVFPRTSSEIRLERGPRGVVGPIDLAAYNPGDSYRRRMVSPEGDHSDYIAVEKGYMRALLIGEFGDLPPDASGDMLFSRMTAMQGRSLFLTPARFVRATARGGFGRRPAPADSLDLEEQGLGLILASLGSGIAGRLPVAAGSEGRRRDLAERAKRLIAERCLDRVTLDGLAAASGVSSGHLARAFRRHAGTSDPPIPDRAEAAAIAGASGRHAGEHHACRRASRLLAPQPLHHGVPARLRSHAIGLCGRRPRQENPSPPGRWAAERPDQAALSRRRPKRRSRF